MELLIMERFKSLIILARDKNQRYLQQMELALA